MKLIFSDVATESINILSNLSSLQNEGAQQLLYRTSIVLTAIRNLENIDDCDYGKVRHSNDPNDPNVPIGHLDRELKGCMAFNIDKSNRIVVLPLKCEDEEYAVILSTTGHYKDNLFLDSKLEDLVDNYRLYSTETLKEFYEMSVFSECRFHSMEIL